MSKTRRNTRINRKKAAEQALGTNPAVISILLSLAEEDPGQPLRGYIRKRLKEIVAANPDRSEILIDVDEVLVLLKESHLRKERLLKARKEPKIPPFPVPPDFAGKFRWVYRVSNQGEILWQMVQA